MYRRRKPPDPFYTPLDKTSAEIVGVVADLRNAGLASPTKPAVFLPMEHLSHNWGHVVLRSGQTTAPLIPRVRQLLESLNPDLQIESIVLGEQIREQYLAPTRSLMMLVGLFAACALCLAAGGTFVVVAYWVETRTREIGIRRAVGASQAQIMRWVLQKGWLVAGTGLMIGLMCAMAGTRFLASSLGNVGSLDPLAWILSGVALFLAVTLATGIPAHRASRIDPNTALRQE